MKKILLFAAVVLLGSTSIAQKKKYLLFEFMKVAPGQESAYIETESFWEKIHVQRVKNSDIEGWQLWHLVDENQDFQYVTVQVFNDSTKMIQNGSSDNFLKMAKKAFPAMSEAMLLSKRTESLRTRNVVETFYLEQIDQTKEQFNVSLGAVMEINLMKVTPENYAKYENAESKIFKPEWQKRVDAGRFGSWSLFRVVNLKEYRLNSEISYVSLNQFKDFNQLFGGAEDKSILGKADQEAWQEAYSTREINSYRVVLIKKSDKGL